MHKRPSLCTPSSTGGVTYWGDGSSGAFPSCARLRPYKQPASEPPRSHRSGSSLSCCDVAPIPVAMLESRVSPFAACSGCHGDRRFRHGATNIRRVLGTTRYRQKMGRDRSVHLSRRACPTQPSSRQTRFFAGAGIRFGRRICPALTFSRRRGSFRFPPLRSRWCSQISGKPGDSSSAAICAATSLSEMRTLSAAHWARS